MGDIADDLIEQGQQAYWDHLFGNCDDGPCQYCEEEERAKRRRRKPSTKKPGRTTT